MGESERRSRRVTLLGLCVSAGAVVCTATLLGFAGRCWWFFDLFSHFQVQYLLSLSLVILLTLLAKRFRASAVLGLFAAANLACILPYYLSADSPVRNGSAPLRFISLNVHTANDRFDLVKQLIRDHDPDIVLLMEVNAEWIEALEELHSVYPHRQVAPREDNFGIALYSKRPFTKCGILYLGQVGVPSVVGEIEVAGQRLTIVGTHPLPPMSAANTTFRNNQLGAIAQYLATVTGPKILMGDLNTSPWSHCFGRLLRRAQLTDSSQGRGVAATWPTSLIWLRIPIDFCLVSEGIIVQDKQVGADVGSDHFPLIVDVALAAH
jgi:endonuclease/exonuclease/phosphatase (EEP) superfamily protein YafD